MKAAVLSFLFLVAVEGCTSSHDCSYEDMCNFDDVSSGSCERCPGQGSTDRIVSSNLFGNFKNFRINDLFGSMDSWSRKYLSSLFG